MSKSLAVACGAALAACTVGPDYHRPVIASPAAYSELSSPAARTGADVRRWWASFNDPVLDRLVERALAANLDLQAAASRVRQARLQEKISRAAEWPTLNANGTAASLNANRGSGSGSNRGFALPDHLNLYSAGFDATWEVDLFGGARRATQEAKANSEAALWAQRDGEVTLTAEVAKDYLALREAQARLAVGEAELARQRDLFGLVQARREAGFVTNLDVNQQTGVVATAAAQLEELRAETRIQIHALAVLLGEAPETLEPQLAAPGDVPRTPALPAVLPSDLLERRPDIREAERKLAASNAEIGVQTARLYPELNLIGLASFAGMSLGDLFSARNITYGGLAMVSEPLFNAGRTRTTIALAKAKEQAASIAYQSTVLAGLRDVEDALTKCNAETARLGRLTQAVTAAQGSLTIARDQYRTGLVTFINVYAAENALLNAQDQLIQSQAQSDSDLTALYKALGGGWRL